MKDLYINDTVFFIIDNKVHEGILTSNFDEYDFAEVEDMTVVKNLKIHKSEIYTDETDAIVELHSRNKNKIEEYRKEINSVKELISFMLKHNTSLEDETNWEARIVAKEKAELFKLI